MGKTDCFDYMIIFEGHCALTWQDWFDFVSIEIGDEKTSMILNQADLSRLYGVLSVMQSFNIPILSLKRL